MEEETPLKQAQHAILDLAVILGIMEASMFSQPKYEPAREGWDERLEEITNWANTQAAEIFEFGEAYDDEDED